MTARRTSSRKQELQALEAANAAACQRFFYVHIGWKTTSSPALPLHRGRSDWLVTPVNHDRTNRFQDGHFMLDNVDVLYCYLCGTRDGFG